MRIAYIIMSLGLVGCSSAEKDEGAAARARDAAVADYYSGKAFVGRDGKKEAQTDISRGSPKLFFYGKTRADIAEWTEIMKERFWVGGTSQKGSCVNGAKISHE